MIHQGSEAQEARLPRRPSAEQAQRAQELLRALGGPKKAVAMWVQRLDALSLVDDEGHEVATVNPIYEELAGSSGQLDYAQLARAPEGSYRRGGAAAHGGALPHRLKVAFDRAQERLAEERERGRDSSIVERGEDVVMCGRGPKRWVVGLESGHLLGSFEVGRGKLAKAGDLITLTTGAGGLVAFALAPALLTVGAVGAWLGVVGLGVLLSRGKAPTVDPSTPPGAPD